MMFASEIKSDRHGKVLKIKLLQEDEYLKYLEVLHLWQDDRAFREFYLALLKSVSFVAFRWETPPITRDTAGIDFEFVLIDNPQLDRTPSEAAFANRFQAASPQTNVISFPNLGRDAMLIVPTKQGDISAYCHLAAFSQKAPQTQQHDLWQATAQLMLQQLNTEKIWLNTAGGGVPWLHIRLDSRPKYYCYISYKNL